MLLSAVSVLVVAQSSSEMPEGLMNNPVVLKGTRYEAEEWFNLAHTSDKLSSCEHSRPNKVRVPQRTGSVLSS